MRSAGPRPKPVTAVVFDMDGTLIESTAAVTAAYRAAVLAGGGPARSDAEVVAAYPLGPPRRILEHLLGRPATDEDVATYHSRLDGGRVSAYDGIAEVLPALTRRVPVAVFTGASRQAATVLLGAAGLAEHFEVIVGGDEVANPKPAPDGVLLACARLGVDPAEAAYVGDSPLDLRAARESGALAVAATWGHLYEPGRPADHAARHPGDLLQLVADRPPPR